MAVLETIFSRLRELLGGPGVDKAALASEQAGPTTSFIRNPYAAHAAPGLSPAALGQILRSSIDGFPERYLALAEDMEERYGHYGSVLATRKRAVAGLEITVEAAGPDKADEDEAALVREVVTSAVVRKALIDMLDAIGKGFSATEIIWETGSVWKPRALEYRDPRFFEFDRLNPGKLLLLADGGREELKTAGWIVHRARAKSGLTIRGGLARQAAWPFLFHAFNLKDWAVFSEAFGTPIRVGKFDPGASPADKAVLLQAVTDIGSDFAAIIPQAMAIEFIKAEITGSTDLYERRAKYLDQTVSKIVLGQTGTTDVIEGGGYASSKVHDHVRDDIQDSDAEQIATTLTEQVSVPLVLFNFGDRANRKGFPEVRFGRPEEEDVAALVRNVKELVPLGLKVGMAEMQMKLGITPPEDGDELLAPQRISAPAVPDDGGSELLPEPPPKDKVKAAVTPAAEDGDAVDAAIAELLEASGWEPLVGPLAGDLRRRLAAAGTIEDARAILAASLAGLDVAALTDRLAQMMFAARLAGEVDDELES